MAVKYPQVEDWRRLISSRMWLYARDCSTDQQLSCCRGRELIVIRVEMNV